VTFAFLATPVRDLGSGFRTERYTSSPDPFEGNRNLWWIDATAHYALPYLDYPPGVRAQLPAEDLRAYPGAVRNRKRVVELRREGLERLPYQSLRSLSYLDPRIGAKESLWQVEPRIVTSSGSDAPYRAGRARAILSHRAPGFSDYLLERLGAVADGLDVRGVYFDQAAPAGSTNRAHLWPGAAPGSRATDILAMRSFFKRLATQLYRRGRGDPLIYVHNSSAPVIPAVTFVTAMVQGEELLPVIKNLDYQASLDLDRIRTTYGPAAAGVPTVWLEELWSRELATQRPFRYVLGDEAGWLASPEYRAAWRNFMGLALVHDIPVWTVAPLLERRAVFDELDRFGVAASRFVPYWSLTRQWREAPLLASAWVRSADDAVLLVLVNRTEKPLTASATDVAQAVDAERLPAGVLAGWPRRELRLKAKDFSLVPIRGPAPPAASGRGPQRPPR
jgi:hypothetical protein